MIYSPQLHTDSKIFNCLHAATPQSLLQKRWLQSNKYRMWQKYDPTCFCQN